MDHGLHKRNAMKTVNKKAMFKYNLGSERIEAGISLTGDEVKAAKRNKVDLTNSHAKIIGGEVFLVNANISGADEPTRTKKLLLKKGEIVSIGLKLKRKRLTFVPTSMYTSKRLIKVSLALGKSKRGFEKRSSLKERSLKKQIAQEFKNR